MQSQNFKNPLWEDIESYRIPLMEINLATHHFSPYALLENNKYCNVYKGKLSQRWHRVAAIKRQTWRGSEGMNEFILLSKCSHENIIPFIGFCDEDDKKIIVTDYAFNGSLDRHIRGFHKRRNLTWANRLKICLGAAKGLDYLQSCLGEDTIVIHRNVQSKYILLDENMEAKICGLNYSRLVPRKQPQVDSPFRHSNTYYLDPVYQESCILKAESVVYSFGVVLFELMSGMLANGERSFGDVKPQGLIKLVRRDYDVGLDNLIDPHIRDQIDRRSFYLVKEMAYKCISLNIKDRPTMDKIVKTIEEALDTHNHGADSIITIRSHQHQNAKDFKIPLLVLKLATKNFKCPIFRGYTQFSSTYEGQLPDNFQNRRAVIKRYDQESGHRDEFLNELDMLCSLHHENIIPFIGYCEEDDEMIIVSEYATNDSLYNRLMLDKSKHCITWAQRLKICLGAARGVKYLHSGLGDRGRVIHRTFSSKRILLDDNMEAKICGFVYSILLPRNQQQVYQPMGAWPYKDPVYHESDVVTTEVDMYSFGLVMFELLIGELFFPPTVLEKRMPYTLMNMVRNNYHAKPYKLVDPAISDQVNIQSLLAYIEVASKCISFNLKDRPSMNRIVKTIEKLLNFQNNESASTTNIRSPESENLEDFKIPLMVLKTVTKDFSTGAQIGDGGFGIVYKGKLSERCQNRTAAIKRLNPGNQARNDEFHKELQLIFNFHHENIIPFIGYSDDENEMIIVTEYAVNGSLDCHLDSPEKRCRLTWQQRLKICLGAAKGLKHLHSGHGEYNKVIHRDVKSANILLDENMEAKICDFGLSRTRPINQATDTGLYTSIGGTEYYIDPIYRESGKLRTASDVYSFGVVLFEILSGKLAYNPIKCEDDNPQLLINLVRRYKTGILDKLMDPYIKDEIDDRSFYTFQDIAYDCISMNYKKRPTMDTIIDRIEEALEYQVSLFY